MTKKDINDFADFFASQEPEKIIAALKLVNEIQDKSIEDLNIAFRLTNNTKIQKILKLAMKMKVDNL
jgi:hypothetical protein